VTTNLLSYQLVYSQDLQPELTLLVEAHSF